EQIAFEPTYDSPQPGWAEQDPEVYRSAVVQCCQRLWSSGALKSADIAGLSLTTQRATMICLDGDGKVLRPAMLWLDQRGCEHPAAMGPLWNPLFRIGGATSLIEHFQRDADANWLAEHSPELWRETKKFLFLSGYLGHWLTGEYVDSSGCQVGYVPFD